MNGMLDGLNITITMNPRALKALYEATKQVDTAGECKASTAMQRAGFNYSPADIAALIRQFQIEVAPLCDALQRQGHVPEPETTTPEPPQRVM